MDLHQRIEIAVGLPEVWQALNDPEILMQCLPGCEEFKSTDTNEFSVQLTAKVGPVKARFNGEVILSDINAPYSYTISGEGKGGVAGFAKGAAEVTLEEKHESGSVITVMVYKVKATVGGKLSQIGSRLVTGAARKMANDFFEQFVLLISGDNVERDEVGNVVIKIETIEAE